jgi:hypothetical protein
VTTAEKESPSEGKRSGAEPTGVEENEGIVEAGGAGAKLQPKQPLPAKSGSSSSPDKSASFHVDGVDDRDEYGSGREGEVERVMSSIESENAVALSQKVRRCRSIASEDCANYARSGTSGSIPIPIARQFVERNRHTRLSSPSAGFGRSDQEPHPNQALFA